MLESQIECTQRECCLSEEIDFVFEEEQQQKKTEAEQEMVEAEALEKFINSPEYQEIISITLTRSRKRHEVLVQINTPSSITQTKPETSLTHQQHDVKLETSNFASNFPRPEIRKA